MADIDQSANESADDVRFTAISPRGDDWMTVYRGTIDVSFDRSEASEARAFGDAAVEAGFTIRDLNQTDLLPITSALESRYF
jgi:hypothetical protein